MKVFFDNLIFSLQRAGGISVVWENLLKNCLGHVDHRFLEYPGAYHNLSRKSLEIPPEDIIAMSLKPKLAELVNPKVQYHDNENFIFHSSYFRICGHQKAINVTTVHDFIYEQGKPTLKQKLRIALNYRAIRKSDAIVCISENTKRDLFKYLPDVNPSKVYVIYNGVSEDYYPIGETPYPEYKSHVMFVGGRQGYKNFDFAVRSLAKTAYKLLICGSPLNERERGLLDQCIPGRYDVVEYPSNNELNKIYNSVHCLLYPSSYEGFGLPVVEAQKAGCPVIALSASSIPEIVGDYPLLMPSLDEAYMIEMLTKIEDSVIRTKVIESGIESAKRFSWQRMAVNYLTLYKTLIENTAPFIDTTASQIGGG